MTEAETSCVTCGPASDLETETCPDCGSVKYEAAEGCSVCFECGYSPCK